MGETSTNIATLNMKQAIKINVKEGCEVDNPCDSNPCPQHSYCSDDWDSYSCVCDPGNPLTAPCTQTGAGSRLPVLIRRETAAMEGCFASTLQASCCWWWCSSSNSSPSNQHPILLCPTVPLLQLQSRAKDHLFYEMCQPNKKTVSGPKGSFCALPLFFFSSVFFFFLFSFLFLFSLFLSQPFLLLDFSLTACILIEIL